MLRRLAWLNDPVDPETRPAFYYVCDSLDEVEDAERGDMANVGTKLYVFTDSWVEIAPGKSGAK